MKEVIKSMFEFIYTLSMGDYFFFIGTFLLIVLFIYVLYLIKLSEIEYEEGENIINEDGFDIESTIERIEKEYKPKTINLTSYEEEQENSAIISYEELIKNKGSSGINYDDEFEYEMPELKVKKINLSGDSPSLEEPKLKVQLMDYEKEEAFLEALKELQKNLSQ